jgi:hypothetical protein
VPTLRCPRCSTLVTAASGGTASCPSCGFTAQVPAVPAPARRAAAKPRAAPAAPPAPPAEALPPLGPPPSDWPAADWTAARPVEPSAGVPAPSFMSPAPPDATPAWAQRGKAVPPATVAILSVVTIGVYLLFFWWRVSREADLLRGHRHAHGLAKTGILMAVLGALVAVLLVAIVLAQAYAGDGTALPQTEQGLYDALANASPAVLVALVLAVMVASAGTIILYVAQYRSWDSIRAAELATGRADPVDPRLYLFLPILVRFAGSALGRVSTVLGDLAALAAAVLVVVFAVLTQAHLDRLWESSVPAPAPAPAAR